jgi:hypothetical protein
MVSATAQRTAQFGQGQARTISAPVWENMMQTPVAAGFWSYVHSDDTHENGRITRLRERLERSIRFYSGLRDFTIFLDRKDIGWGERWAERLSDSIDDALLLFPVVTPSYFSSRPCRHEALAFQAREEKLGRSDLILPIYYLATDLMDGGGPVSPTRMSIRWRRS